MLQISDLTIGFENQQGSRLLIQQLSVEVNAGQLGVVLGRNGTGKTTLLRTIAGFQKPLAGAINLHNRPLREYSAKVRAQQFSLVLTERVNLNYFTVRDLIALGRYPYTGFLGRLSEADERMIQEVAEAVGVWHLADQTLSRLSDGEHQKVMIARALTQDTPLLLLDEPTAHLDMINRIEIFRLLRDISSRLQKTILCATHELELALRIADIMVLLDGQGNVAVGTPNELLQDGSFERIFAAEGLQFSRTNLRFEF